MATNKPMEITMSDGTVHVLTLTPLDMMKMAEKGQKEGWKDPNDIRKIFYGAYWHLRRNGDVSMSFERFCEDMSDFGIHDEDDDAEENEESPKS